MRLTGLLAFIVLAEVILALEISPDAKKQTLTLCKDHSVPSNGIQARVWLNSGTTGNCNATVYFAFKGLKEKLDFVFHHFLNNSWALKVNNEPFEMSETFESLTVKLAQSDSLLVTGGLAKPLDVSPQFTRGSCFKLEYNMSATGECGISINIDDVYPTILTSSTVSPTTKKPSTTSMIALKPTYATSSTAVANGNSSGNLKWWVYLIIGIAALILIVIIIILIICIIKCRKGKASPSDSMKNTEKGAEEGQTTFETVDGPDVAIDGGISTRNYDATKTMPSTTSNNSDTAMQRSSGNENTAEDAKRLSIKKDDQDKLTVSQSHYLGGAAMKPAVASKRYKAKP